MTSNPIDNTIVLPSEKCGMTNQKPDTLFFISDRNRIGFFLHCTKLFVALTRFVPTDLGEFLNVRERI
jgi:hypothetical protein